MQRSRLFGRDFFVIDVGEYRIKRPEDQSLARPETLATLSYGGQRKGARHAGARADGVLADIRTPGGSTSTAQFATRLAKVGNPAQELTLTRPPPAPP